MTSNWGWIIVAFCVGLTFSIRGFALTPVKTSWLVAIHLAKAIRKLSPRECAICMIMALLNLPLIVSMPAIIWGVYCINPEMALSFLMGALTLTFLKVPGVPRIPHA